MWTNGGTWEFNISGVLKEMACDGVKRSRWRALWTLKGVFVQSKVTKIVIYLSNTATTVGSEQQRDFLDLNGLLSFLHLYLPSYLISSSCLTKFLNAFQCCSSIFKKSVDIRGAE